MTQAYQRCAILASNSPMPLSHQLSHEIFTTPTAREVADLHSRFFGHTDVWRTRNSLAQDRKVWAGLEVLR